MNSASLRFVLLVSACSAPVIAAASCGGGGDTGTSSSGATANTGGAGHGSGGAGGDLFGTGGTINTGPFLDFPKDPIIDATAPPNAPTLFGPAGSGMPSGGPCLFEPEPGALFPNNWLRPRFRFAPGANQNLFEIRLHADNEVNDLVVYTGDTSWKMPKPMWTGLT